MSEKRSKRACLRHQRGASLPLALLLTLICAMAASIVIAAGTAAAGRAAGLAESDKLYYSVTSAARLFRDELFMGDSKTQAHSVTVALSKSAAETKPTLTIVRDDGTEAKSDENLSILERAAFLVLFGSSASTGNNVTTIGEAQSYLNTRAINFDTWLATFAQNLQSDNVGTFELSYPASGDDNGFEIDVCVETSSEGNLVFKFRDRGKTNDLLVMTCTGDFSTQEAAMTGDVPIKAVTVKWTPSDISKVSDESAAP